MITIDDRYASNIFERLPAFEKVRFRGFPEPKLQHFKAEREGATSDILIANIIRKDERVIWDAAVDLIKRSVTEASAFVKGAYLFDLFSFDAVNELNGFNHKELTQLLINHSRKIPVGKKRPVKYSTCCGFLHKLREVPWPKIEFKSEIEVYSKTPEQFDLLIKKLLNCCADCGGNAIIIVNDLSRLPIYDKTDLQQAERLAKTLDRMLKPFDAPPEIIVHSSEGIERIKRS